MTQESPDRQKLVEEKIRNTEAQALTSLAMIRRVVKDYLIHEKGYRDEDIEVDAEFGVFVDNRETRVSVDYILNLLGRRLMVIKCSPGAVESRERHLVSLARVVDSYRIPFAVVTDGVHARVLDTLKGKAIAEGLDSLPERPRAVEMIDVIEFGPYPPERAEKEKRILLAFESIKCTEESCE
jgi:hypothetical protein